MGEAASPAPASALWDWDYLDRCFARHRVCISFGLWICSTSCWIAAHTLLLYLRCAKKSGRDQSVLCAACCLLSSLCDTIGAILARQLTIQVFTGAYLAAADLVNFVFILFPICGCQWKSHRGRGSQERTRRQRLRASVFALALPLSLGPGWALWATTPKASGPVRGSQRRLLESLLQDNTEVLGYLLGGIAVFGSWASQIPPLSRINSDWVPLTTLPPCKSLRTMAAISRYLELTIEPVQQPCGPPPLQRRQGREYYPLCWMRKLRLQEDAFLAKASCSTTRLPGDGQMSPGDATLEEPPSYPPVQVIRARVSSSSSCEVSSINSDLEQKYWEALNSEQWDPEDVNLKGNKDNVDMLGSQAHRGSMGPVVLTSDEEHLMQGHQLRALSQTFVRNGAGINLQ
ncbi:transmembrane protein 44 isoform X13 [Lutra lutra]|uniref:transmembrane protein 44 isoform X13 n=1 Tax=Lutra lutra TaxID=9657 RepID=UPI001FD2A5B7|nr:transmembrane protein 44 isoform X13 [Lutra lutra]